MKVLVVDHNAVLLHDRAVYRALSNLPDLTLRLLVPSRWFDNFRMVSAEMEDSTARYSVRCIPALLPSRTHRMVYPTLRREVGQFDPDILFVNAEPENFQTAHAARTLRARPDLRLVFSTWRNIDFSSAHFPYRFARLHAAAERYVLSRADHGIAFTPASIPVFAKLGYGRLTHITPAVNTSLFRPDPAGELRQQLGLTQFTIVFAGRFVPEKGVDLALLALRDFDAPFHLVLIGAGPAERAWRALASKLGIADRVLWPGPVSHTEMPRYLNAADILLLPSRTTPLWKEQFGRVLLEAMACGKPVLGSTSGEIPSVIGDAGVVFAEGDVADLASKLRRLSRDRALSGSLGTKGRIRAETVFSPEHIASRYLETFSFVLRGGPRPGIRR